MCLARWLRPLSLALVTPPVAGHAPSRWSRPPVGGHAPRLLVTPPVAGHAPSRWSRPPVAGHAPRSLVTYMLAYRQKQARKVPQTQHQEPIICRSDAERRDEPSRGVERLREAARTLQKRLRTITIHLSHPELLLLLLLLLLLWLWLEGCCCSPTETPKKVPETFKSNQTHQTNDTEIFKTS